MKLLQPPANNGSGSDEDDFNSDSDVSNSSDEQNSATLPDKSRKMRPKAMKPHETGAGISSGGGGGGSGSGGGRPRAAAKEQQKCYRCGQVGHIKSQCPKTPQSIMGAAYEVRG